MALRLNGQSTGYTELNAPDDGDSVVLTMPGNDGDAGQYLQTNGSGALSWQTLPTNEILQVVSAVNDTAGLITNTTAWQNTGLTATITPTAANSRILVQVNQYTYSLNSQVNVSSHRLRLRRDTTVIDDFSAKGVYVTVTAAHAIWGMTPLIYMDTPTYTVGDDLVYDTEIAADNATNLTLRWNLDPSTITLMEIAA